MGDIFLTSETRNVVDRLAKEITLSQPRVAFITTATEPEPDKDWLVKERESIASKTDWRLFDYTITEKTSQEISADLADADMLYVTGGNVFYLLHEIQKSGFRDIVQNLRAAGKTYIGQSAGAIVAGPDIEPAYRTDKINTVPDLASFEALGIVPFVVLPHWGTSARRSMYLDERLPRAYSEKYAVQLLTDYQYLRVKDSAFYFVDTRF